MPGPPFLEADRVQLRTAERDDVPFLQDAVSDPRIWRAVGRPRPHTLDQEEAFYERVFCGDQGVRLLVTLDQLPIGYVGFESIDEHAGSAELNYWIVPSHWREGYGSEAVARLLDYGFDQYRLHKVVARVTAFNDASMALLEGLGFAEEGVQRDQEFVDGAYQDRHWYGLLRSEWVETA